MAGPRAWTTTEAMVTLERIAERHQPPLPDYLYIHTTIEQGNTSLIEAVKFFLETDARDVRSHPWAEAFQLATAEEYAREKGWSYQEQPESGVVRPGGPWIEVTLFAADGEALIQTHDYWQRVRDPAWNRIIRAQIALDARGDELR